MGIPNHPFEPHSYIIFKTATQLTVTVMANSAMKGQLISHLRSMKTVLDFIVKELIH